MTSSLEETSVRSSCIFVTFSSWPLGIFEFLSSPTILSLSRSAVNFGLCGTYYNTEFVLDDACTFVQ